MTPDYEADRDEAEEPCGQLGPKGIDWKPNENSCLGEPDRPWREAAEACWKDIGRMPQGTPTPTVIMRIESAIEKAVEKTELERNEEAWARSQANVALQMSELEVRKLTGDVREMKKERDALRAEVERRQSECLELHEKMGEWTAKAIKRADEIADLEGEVKTLEYLDQSRVDELHRALYPDGGELDWGNHIEEVRRLKAAKPKVAWLTREELIKIFSTPSQTTRGMISRGVDAILDLQAKKAAEVEAGDE